MPICPSCGSDNQGESNYCSKCGFEIYSATGRISPDTLLEGRYLIVETIGRGGMGAVYKALDTRLKNTPVAVKEMSTNALGQGKLKEAVEAFEKEAAMLIELRHPALPRVTDYFSQGEDRWYIVMDCIEGKTLESIANERGPIAETELTDWTQQICGVLNYLHKLKPPVVFRDLKPANIMLTSNNEIKLIDFGIARHFKPETTADTRHYASLGFSPPEQYGQKQTDARSDIYSLGVTMHYLITGLDPRKNPFHFTPPIEYGFGSSKLSAFIMKAVNVNPDDRFQTVGEMIEQIGSIPLEKLKNIDTKTAAIPNEKIKPISDRLSKKTEFLNFKPAKNIWSKKTKILAAASAVLIALLFASYYFTVNYYPIQSIAFEAAEIEIELNSEGVKLNVLFEPSFASSRDLTWKSTTPFVATVSDDGIIQPKNTGTAVITANTKQGNHKANCSIKVVNPTISWDGGTYIGELKDNKPYGYGEWSHTAGQKYIGEWENGKWHGRGTYIHANGVAEKGYWENGIQNLNYIDSIKAIIRSIKFYNSGFDIPEKNKRIYSNRFTKSEAQYICYEINLLFLNTGSSHKKFDLYAIYYFPNGNIMGRPDIEAYIGAEDLTRGQGYQNKGNWQRGIYKAEIYIEGALVATEYFEIY